MPRSRSSSAKRHSSPNRQNRTGWRRVLFPPAAVLLALLPFLLLEAALRGFDVGGGGDAETAGFNGSRLFELDEDDETYTTARHRLLFFGRQEFAREKPERTFRIFGLGGSTVHGRPYANGSSFLKWMELELSGRDSTREYETVNCGGLSYASYRLTTLLQEVLQYDPDLIVIATGHNEFLEDRTYRSQKNRPAFVRWAAQQGSRLRTVMLARQFFRGKTGEPDDPNDRSQLAPDVEARLDDQSGYASYHRDDQWRQDVIDEYDQSLRHMVEACRQAGVPLILVNLGENLRDCPPFKSEHRAELAAVSLQQWQAFFDQAETLDDSEPTEALRLYGKAEAIDDAYALLAFRMARCHDRLGNSDRAREYYQKARQLDICPLRMVDELHESLERVALEMEVPLVDAQALALNQSPDGIPGNNCFMDHVHPDIGSHQQIGRLLADQAEATGLVSANREWTETQRRRAYRRHFRRLGPAYLANGRRRVGWLENWARSERLDQEAAPIDARSHLHLGKKRLDYGEIDAAWEQFRLALDEEPQRIDEIFDYAFDLFSQGRVSLAEQLLVRLHREPLAESYRPAILMAYTVAALDAGENEQSQIVAARHADSIQKAVTDPKLGRWITALPAVSEPLERLIANRADLPTVDPNTDPFLAPAVTAPTAPAEAEPDRPSVADLLDRAIVRNPENASLHLSRARIRFSKQAYDDALADVTRCLELAPEDTEALKFRAILHMIQNDAQAAVDDLTAAVELDANSPDLFRMRAAAYRRLKDDTAADADLEAAEKLAPSEPGSSLN